MNPTCETGCATKLPVVNFEKCAPKTHLSEIEKIYLAKPVATPFTDWKVAAEWTTRISQSDIVSDDAIRPLTVIADKPAPSNVVKELSNGRKKSVRKDHVLNVTIDENSEENYEMTRQFECGGDVKIWYETSGGLLYGGNEGIDATIILDENLNRGRDEIALIIGTISWSSDFSPERTLSPIV